MPGGLIIGGSSAHTVGFGGNSGLNPVQVLDLCKPQFHRLCYEDNNTYLMTYVGKVLIQAAHPIKLVMTKEFDFLGLQIGDLEF